MNSIVVDNFRFLNHQSAGNATSDLHLSRFYNSVHRLVPGAVDILRESSLAKHLDSAVSCEEEASEFVTRYCQDLLQISIHTKPEQTEVSFCCLFVCLSHCFCYFLWVWVCNRDRNMYPAIVYRWPPCCQSLPEFAQLNSLSLSLIGPFRKRERERERERVGKRGREGEAETERQTDIQRPAKA